MRGSLTVPWLRFVPRRLSLTDAAAHTHTVDWLDPTDPRRTGLPRQTRAGLDDVEATFKPAIWGRYSWRSLITVALVVLFAAAVIVGVGSYAMFPRRAIIALLVFVLSILPGIWLGVLIASRVWLRRTGAAARINACLAGARCPACLAEIDSLTARPIDTVTCPCGASWPTLGALQSGNRSIPVAGSVARTNELAWLIPCALISAVVSLAVPVLSFRNTLVGAIAGLLVVFFFTPFITAGRRSRALRFALALAVPPLVVMLVVLARGQGVNLTLLLGGVAAFAVVFFTARLGPRHDDRPGWNVARFVCESCGYDLRGAPGHGATLSVCPECGHAVRPTAAPPPRGQAER